MLQFSPIMVGRLSYNPQYRRNLPHYQPAGATFFVTFRLAGSLPLDLLRQWREEADARERLSVALPPGVREQQRYEDQKRDFGRYDAEMDRATYGPTWLREPDVAVVVRDALHARHGQLYDLDAFTIMPNHVHLVFTPLPTDDSYVSLPYIMHSLKRGTAWSANTTLGRKGAFWQHESYDHFARDAQELGRIVRYVIGNPVKAGLVESWDEWPWTYWKHAP